MPYAMDKFVIRKTSLIPQGNSAPSTSTAPPRPAAKVDVEMSTIAIIQDILLKYCPAGVPIERLPELCKKATQGREDLDYTKYGFNDLYSFLRQPCFNKVIEVRKLPKQQQYNVKGCPLALTAIGLLGNQYLRDERPVVELAPPAVDRRPVVEAEKMIAIMASPIPDLNLQDAKATEAKEEKEEKPKVEEKEANPKLDELKASEAKPKLDELKAAVVEAKCSSSADGVGIGISEEAKPKPLEIVKLSPVIFPADHNTCKVVALFTGNAAPGPEPNSPNQAEAAAGQKVASEKNHSPQPQAGLAPAPSPGSPPIPETPTIATTTAPATTSLMQSDAFTTGILAIMKGFQETLQRQNEMLMAVTQRIGIGHGESATATPMTPKPPTAQRYHQQRCMERYESAYKKPRLYVKHSPSATPNTLKPRTPPWFTSAPTFNEKAKHYLGKYGKKDHADEIAEYNLYVLHLNFLSRHLPEEAVQDIFPKAYCAVMGPSNNGRTQFLNLLFKHPKRTKDARKLAEEVFGSSISISYGVVDKLN